MHTEQEHMTHALSTNMLVEYTMSRVCLRRDKSFRLPVCNICGRMCWTCPFELWWLKRYIHNPSYYHHQIGSIHLSHFCHIFFCGCVSEMVILSYSVIYYIYIPGTQGPCFHYWCSVHGICKWSDTSWPVGRVRFFADYSISLSSLFRLNWRHWTTIMLVRYTVPSVCLRLRQSFQLSFIRYMGLCVFSLPNYPVMVVRMCILSYYHHRIGSMNR